MRRKITAVGMILLTAACMAGCTKAKNLTEEENNMVAQYAANIIIENSYKYKNRYPESQNTSEEETNVAETETETTPQETETTPESENNMFTAAINTAGITAKYNGYKVVKEYPDHDEALFTFEAQSGYSFVVFNIELSNTGNESMSLNTVKDNPLYKIKLNNRNYNNYANLLLNDISGLKDVVIEAHGTYDAVLVFMVEDKEINNVKSMTVSYGAKNMRIV